MATNQSSNVGKWKRAKDKSSAHKTGACKLGVRLFSNGSNVKEWEKALVRHISKKGMQHYLEEHFSMQADRDLVYRMSVERFLARDQRTSNANMLQEAQLQKLITKEGISSLTESDQKVEAIPIDSQMLTTPNVRAHANAQGELTQTARKVAKEKEREERIRKNAEMFIRQRANKQSPLEIRAQRNIAFYLAPYTALSLNQKDDRAIYKHVNPFNGEEMWYELESDEDQAARYELYEVMSESLVNVPKHVTAAVVDGDIHALYTRIITHYDDIGRQAIVASIESGWAKLQKWTHEPFLTFTSKVKELRHLMSENNMLMDEDLIMNKIQAAIHKDPCAAEVMNRVLVGKTPSWEELLDLMKGPMDAEERKSRALRQQERDSKKGTHQKSTHPNTQSTRVNKATAVSKPCFRFAETGECPFGDKCWYEHQDVDGKAKFTQQKNARKEKKAGKNHGKGKGAPRTRTHVKFARRSASNDSGDEDTSSGEEQQEGFNQEVREFQSKHGLTDEVMKDLARLMVNQQ
jgi:hypothetical protein